MAVVFMSNLSIYLLPSVLDQSGTGSCQYLHRIYFWFFYFLLPLHLLFCFPSLWDQCLAHWFPVIFFSYSNFLQSMTFSFDFFVDLMLFGIVLISKLKGIFFLVILFNCSLGALFYMTNLEICWRFVAWHRLWFCSCAICAWIIILGSPCTVSAWVPPETDLETRTWEMIPKGLGRGVGSDGKGKKCLKRRRQANDHLGPAGSSSVPEGLLETVWYIFPLSVVW